MPETYGIPDPETTREEKLAQFATQAIAGQGIVRRILLYSVLVVSNSVAYWFPPALAVSLLAIILLVATDEGLE